MPRLDYAHWARLEELGAQQLADAMNRRDGDAVRELRAELRKIAAVTLPRRRFSRATCARIARAAELCVAGLSWKEIADELQSAGWDGSTEFVASLRKPGRYKDALRVEVDTLRLIQVAEIEADPRSDKAAIIAAWLRLGLTLPHNRRD